MTRKRAEAFRDLLKQWVEGLYKVHPHTVSHKKRTNVHVAFHLYDFLLLFGPVLSWWCFPFERLIGTLQKINTNNHIGGEMEATILKSYVKSATLRRWLNRKDCPELVHTLKRLFNKTFGSDSKQLMGEATPTRMSSESRDCAHYTFGGVNYSRASAHLGNSLVLCYPSINARPVAGSIQRIELSNGQPFFHILLQQPLPPNKHDPFRRFPHFFATTYSSKMSSSAPIRVHASNVLSHVARFQFSQDRAVILNLSRVRVSSFQ
ncbi:hypothetical protein F5051DRAFT_336049 [Lentinula edodes]|nr:hypothetical protein F5051DRAFT_336049 [Lentinula edodes]